MTGKDLAILSKLKQGFGVRQQKERNSRLKAMQQTLSEEDKKIFSLLESFYNRYKEKYKVSPKELAWFDECKFDFRRFRIWKQMKTIHKILVRLDIDQEKYLGFLFRNTWYPKIYALATPFYTGPYLSYCMKDGTLLPDESKKYWDKFVQKGLNTFHFKTREDLYKNKPDFTVWLPEAYLAKDEVYQTLFRQGIFSKLPPKSTHSLEV
jgi:hypothetical protein